MGTAGLCDTQKRSCLEADKMTTTGRSDHGDSSPREDVSKRISRKMSQKLGPKIQCLQIRTGRLDREGNKKNEQSRKEAVKTVSITWGINEVLLLQ